MLEDHRHCDEFSGVDLAVDKNYLLFLGFLGGWLSALVIINKKVVDALFL